MNANLNKIKKIKLNPFCYLESDNKKKYVIKTKNLVKKYKKICALNNVTITINKNDSIAIVGANGSGKTTLIQMLSRCITPTAGEIYYNFQNFSLPGYSIGYQLQDSTFPAGLCINDVINFYKKIYADKYDIKEVNKILNILDLRPILKKPRIKNLSGGQKQRFNILLALMNKPSVLILDEVSTGLDILARERILIFLKKLLKRYNCTLILVSHQIDEIETLANRIVILENGNIVADNKCKNIIEKHNSISNYIKKYFFKNYINLKK